MMHRKLVGPATAAAFILAAGTGLAASAPAGGQTQPQQQSQPSQQEPQARDIKEHVNSFLGKALQQNPLSPQQAQQIDSALDSAVQQFQARRPERQATINKELQLFESNKLDKGALQNLQNQQMSRASQTFVNIVSQVHQVLTPAQRQELATYVRSHEAEGGFGAWH